MADLQKRGSYTPRRSREQRAYRLIVTGGTLVEVTVDAPVLVSGAGHDAQNPSLSGVPTGMIFVRSTGGSHNPNGLASTDDAALGAQALELAIRELAST